MSYAIVDLTGSSPLATDDLICTPALVTAIDTAQLDRLRVTLKAVCNSSLEASVIARKLLLVQKKTLRGAHLAGSPPDNDNEDESENEDADGGSEEDEADDQDREAYESAEKYDNATILTQNGDVVAPKRLKSRYATCEHCSEEFDVTDNGNNECVWHDGEREVDYESETWCDWDEDCHGRYSDQEDDYPEGFAWTCCDRPGHAEGCQQGPHVEKKVSHKRIRY